MFHPLKTQLLTGGQAQALRNKIMVVPLSSASIAISYPTYSFVPPLASLSFFSQEEDFTESLRDKPQFLRELCPSAREKA
jgi:hypothetical protein